MKKRADAPYGFGVNEVQAFEAERSQLRQPRRIKLQKRNMIRKEDEEHPEIGQRQASALFIPVILQIHVKLFELSKLVNLVEVADCRTSADLEAFQSAQIKRGSLQDRSERVIDLVLVN